MNEIFPELLKSKKLETKSLEPLDASFIQKLNRTKNIGETAIIFTQCELRLILYSATKWPTIYLASRFWLNVLDSKIEVLQNSSFISW